MAVVIASNLRKEISGSPLFDGVSFKIERPDRIDFFATRRIKESPRHVLPKPLGMMRISPDQASRALFQQVFRSAFPYARDPSVGLYRNHMVALVKKRIGIWRQIHAHTRDLHLGKRGSGYVLRVQHG